MNLNEIFPILLLLFILFCPGIYIFSSIIRGTYLNKIGNHQNFKYSFLCYIPLIQPIATMNIPETKELSIFSIKINKKIINMCCIIMIFTWQLLILPIMIFPRISLICIPIIVGIFNYRITKDILDIYNINNGHTHAIIAQIIPFYKTIMYSKCVKILEGKIPKEINEPKEYTIKDKIENKPKKEKKIKNNNDIYNIDNDNVDDKYQL